TYFFGTDLAEVILETRTSAIVNQVVLGPPIGGGPGLMKPPMPWIPRIHMLDLALQIIGGLLVPELPLIFPGTTRLICHIRRTSPSHPTLPPHFPLTHNLPTPLL